MLQVNRYFILTNTRTTFQRESRALMSVTIRNCARPGFQHQDRHRSGQPFYSRLTFTKIQGTTMTFYLDGKDLIQVVGHEESDF